MQSQSLEMILSINSFKNYSKWLSSRTDTKYQVDKLVDKEMIRKMLIKELVQRRKTERGEIEESEKIFVINKVKLLKLKIHQDLLKIFLYLH